MHLTAPPPALSWWRTIRPFRRRVRTGSGAVWRRLITVLVVVALVVAGFFLVPLARSLFEDTRDKLGKASQVTPTTVTAGAEAPGHPASAATDGITNQWWGAPALGDSLTCAFATPFRLVGVVVHAGGSTAPEEFRRGARPTRLDLSITAKDGRVTTRTMTLDDRPGPQTLRMGVSDVVSVRFTVRAAAGPVTEQPIALGEVEFFKRT
ncbi:NADase-type glycan-binding domain-containing protein [Embleya hyalina]|uniref:NADase-type glycan-binding domain-containing protein n=1 Tax=Embleya hyalina TaxID=516124 RepID=UPI001FE464A9|nr:zinc ribbon domain-containing protein [Embleya hyalina]